jgi:hypothetical protein
MAEEVDTTDVDVDVDEDVVQLGFWYNVNPFGPPHSKPELPAHGMSQRPSVAGTLPEAKALPQ